MPSEARRIRGAFWLKPEARSPRPCYVPTVELSGSFVACGQVGAGWVLYLLVVLSIVSVGVMIDRAIWFRGRDVDTERFTRELRGAFERGEVDRLTAKHKDDPAVPVQV